MRRLLLDAGLMTGTDHGFTIEALDLHRDWAGVNRLLEIEEWPFIRADLEVSESQPRSIGLVARDNAQGHVIGFFTIHHFDDVGYLDLTIIDPAHRRNLALGNEMWKRAKVEMRRAGFTSQIAHCTRSTSRFLQLLGFRAGTRFRLLRKDEQGDVAPLELAQRISAGDLQALVALDADVFGASRAGWLRVLAGQPTASLFGRFESGRLAASACLRGRRENGLCIDSCNARSFADMRPLLDDILRSFPHKRLECFVREGSDLECYLEDNGFYVPGFFREIGPLIEFRAGRRHEIGVGPDVRTLSWI